MKVILTEKVPALGNIGEIVNVSAGHARNYLVPNGFAMVADDSNKNLLAAQQKSLAKKIQAQKDEANALKAKIEGMTIELIKKVGASGKLFGTVTNAELSKELANLGVEVERRLIHLEAPIKGLGIFNAKAKKRKVQLLKLYWVQKETQPSYQPVIRKEILYCICNED